MKLKGMLKKLISLVCVVALMLPSFSTVAMAAIDTTKGETISLGISILHPNSDSDGNKFGYKIGNRVTYRTYVNNNGKADYSTYIFCLDMNGKFPTEDGTSNSSYTSQGEFTVSNAGTLDASVADEIAYLLKNSNLYDDFEDRIAEVFAVRIEEDKDLIPPTTVETIADIITEDDLFFAIQIVIWEITNNLDLSDQAITYTIDGSVYNGEGTYSSKAELIKEAVEYYEVVASNYDYLGTTSDTNPTIKETTKTTVEEGDYIYVGPFHITSGTNTNFTVTFKDQNDNALSDYTLVTEPSSSGTKVTNIKRYLDTDLYVKLPANTSATKVKMELDVTGVSQDYLTLWTSSVSNAQPLVSVTEESKDVHEETEVTITKSEKIYDLALRKYITSINGSGITSRIPEVTYNSSTNSIEYEHRKDAVTVNAGDTVVYTITVYNEGNEKGTATKVRDYLPEGLEFVEYEVDSDGNYVSGSEINYKYGWLVSADGSYATTAYTENYELDAFDATTMSLSSISIQIECKVSDDFADGILTNLAEIMEDDIDDIDSVPGSIDIDDVDLEDYKGKDSNKDDLTDSDYFYEGQEDDDDFEKLKVEPETDAEKIDLALRKYIQTVNGENQNREPEVDTSGLVDGTSTTATYSHSKDPVQVNTGDIVIYTIKIYNEGDIDAYANEITDYLPEGLGFLVNHEVNYNNGWKIDTTDSTPQVVKLSTIENATSNITSSSFIDSGEVADEEVAVGPLTIRTDMLKYTTGGNDNVIVAFDKTTGKISSISVQVACVVIADELDEDTLKNIAAITGEADGDGLEITDGEDIKDRDSEPEDVDVDKYPEDTNLQDDDDYEDLVLTSKDYDLALKKFITSINNEEVTPSREPVADSSLLSQDGIEDATYTMTKDTLEVAYGDTIIYTIRVYNEGEVDATVKEIVDSLPDGLEFVEYEVDSEGNYVSGSEVNYKYGWKVFEDTTSTGWTSGVKTDYLADTVIPAYDAENDKLSYVDVQIEFKVNTKSSTAIKNIAEITDDDGDDRDSTPNNEDPDEDDEDYETVIPKDYDLALKKFVTSINNEDVSPSREPVVDSSPLADGKTDADYTMSKETLKVAYGDSIIYTIRIYNEGEVDAIVNEVVDSMPDGLEFVEYEVDSEGNYVSGSEVNYKYGWEIFEDTTSTGWTSGVKTTYLADTVIPAYDAENDKLSYVDIQIEFKVVTQTAQAIKNIAEITDDDGDDRDSTPDNEDPDEDDEDYETVIPVLFDLSLQKFITALNGNEVTGREPQVIINDNGEIEYTHTSTPLDVANENLVTYTIRVYNEGTISGYASVIKDDIPDGLVFLPDNETNVEYMWKMYREVSSSEDTSGLTIVTFGGKNYVEVSDASKADIIATEYYSKENCDSRGESAIKAYDQETGITDENPDYRDVKVVFQVDQDEIDEEDRVIINTAEIADDQDEDGNPIDDVDSTPNNDTDGEDDIDKERITVKYFDLSLLKYVSKVVVDEDGTVKTIETGYDGTENPEPVVKVEINRKKLNVTTVKFTFTIKITNEGELEGYATEITDYVPDGLIFEEEDNTEYGWEETEDGVVKTTYLKDTLLQPGESATVQIVFTWDKSASNLGLKTNVAEISEDYNEYNTPDIDSTPDNKVDGEDDQDDASVILSISTGGTQVYVILTISVLTILSCGVFAIKKYVLK